MTNDIKDIREKILAGLKISTQRLLEYKRERNLDLMISRNGQIIHMRLQDVKID